MRKTKVVRAFKPEFLRHCLTFGWPSKEDMIAWCVDHNHVFVKSGVYARITAGEPTDERHIVLILGFFLDKNRRKSRERVSLDLYLRERGIDDTDGLTSEELLDVVSYRDEEPDGGFGLGLHVFVRLCALKRTVSQHVRLINKDNEAQVRSGVRWIYAEAGRQLNSAKMSDLDAAGIGQEAMDFPQFGDWVIAMWRAQPWCFVQAVGTGGITGACMTLAVTPSFYYRCRAGECRPEEATKGDLLPASHYQIVIALAVRPDIKDFGPLGLSLVTAIICQQARLSDVPGIFSGDPLRILSFTGTPVGTRRLKSFGYKLVGTHFPSNKTIRYMERRLDLLEGQNLDWLVVGTWQGIQKHLRKVYGPVVLPEPALAAESGGVVTR